MSTGKSDAHRLAEFGVVGLAIALLSFVQLWLYIDILEMPAGIAYLLQTVISIELNYIGNYFLAWRDRRKDIKLVRSHIIFWGTRGVMTIINPFIFLILEGYGVNYLIAQAAILVANTAINYVTSDRLVFRQNTKEASSNASTAIRERHRASQESS